MARAVTLGDAIRGGLRKALAGTAGMVDIRGDGLMIGVELDRPCGDLVKQALAAGLLINVTADKVVRLLPPLVMSDAEAAELVQLARRPDQRIPRSLPHDDGEPRHFLQLKDLSRDELDYVFERTRIIKARFKVISVIGPCRTARW
jgi:hypothetical protein